MSFPALRNREGHGLDQLFGDFWNLGAARGGPAFPAPAAEIRERKTEFVLRLEVPGFRKEDLKVELDGELLRITGTLREPAAEAGEELLYRERPPAGFERSFALPAQADAAGIQARQENGVLELRVPKTEQARPREVKISEVL